MRAKPTYEELERRINELEKREVEHKYYNEEFQVRKKILEVLNEKAPLGYQSLDENGHFISVNQTWLDILGYDRGEVIGKSFADFLHPDWRHHFAENFPRFKSIGEVLGVEHEMLKKNGEIILASFNGKISRNENGSFQQTHCIFHDITERRRHEVELRMARELSARIIEDGPVAIALVDRRGKIVFANRQAEHLFGLESTNKKALNYNSTDLSIVDVDGTPFLDERLPFRQVMSTDQAVYDVQHAITRPDGVRRILSINGAPLHDEQGQVKRIVFSILDITERKRVEEALRKSEETYRALVEGLPDIVMRFDRNCRHLFVSDNVDEVVGIEAAQFIGKTHTELGFPEAQCRFWEESIRRVFDSGIPFETEFTVETKPAVTLNWRLIPERDAQGGVSSVLSVSRDITAQRKAEQGYKILFREMLDGFALHEIVCDAEGEPVDYRFLAVNPAFERMTGLKAESILGRTVLEVLPGTEKHWIKTYGKVALSGEPAFFKNYASKLGKHFEVTAFRPFAGQFVCIFHDITERKQAEAEREKLMGQFNQAQKMESVGRLAGGVAHDFNNMLGAILGYTEMAMGRVEPDEPLHADLVNILDAAQRSADLTRQLLAFAREQAVSPKVIDLNDTIENMLKLLRRLIGEDIDLTWRPGKEVSPVKMDPAQIDQILANLCVNARDAIAGAGTVTIETGNTIFDEDFCKDQAGSEPGEYAMLAVSDNGCGMDGMTQTHIFEPFFTTKKKGKGTGLGLASVYGAVKQNHGFINVYSEPGQGTTFKIYLPRYAVKSDREAKMKASKPNGNGFETILLVEDEPVILNMTVTMLELLGYTVLPAATPGEALRLAEEHDSTIDLLITDVIMPEMNGLELAGKLESLRPGLKRLFISGYTANVIANHGVLDEDKHFLQKPYLSSDLANKVREVLVAGESGRNAA